MLSPELGQLRDRLYEKAVPSDQVAGRLTSAVAKKTGLPEAQAKQAVEVVIGFLKRKLPAPVASQIDGILGGGTSQVADVAKGLGGLLKKK